MDSLLDLNAFTCIAEAQSLSGAAVVLGVTPSAVSKRLTRLERRLGVQLVHRTTRQFRLTEDGRLFFERCKHILSALRDAEREVARSTVHVQGTVRIAAPPELTRHVLLPALPALLADYPELSVDLKTSDVALNPLTHRVDVALFYGKPTEASLIHRLMSAGAFSMFAAPEYLRRFGTPRSPADLGAHVWLLPTDSAQAFEWRFVEEPLELTPQRRLFASAPDTLLELAVMGLGIARLSTVLTRHQEASGRLVSLLVDHTDGALPIYARYAPADSTSPRVRATLDWMADALAPNR